MKERKNFIVSLIRESINKGERLHLTDLVAKGVSLSEIRKLFGNMGDAYKEAGFNYFKRKRNSSDEEIRDYIKSIATIDITTNCWTTNLLSCQEGTKRARLRYKSKLIFLYRVSFLLFNGPLVPNLLILHLCDNEACFNPEHLEQGTAKKNAEDRESRRLRPKNNDKLLGFKYHKLTDPYNLEKLLAYVKGVITISDKNEWLYPYYGSGGYARIVIKQIEYRVHRLILANKLGIKYEDVNIACHKFPEGLTYSGDAPARNDVNPDHLYDGNQSQNSKDSLKYHKGVKLTGDQKNIILEEAKKTDFCKLKAYDFDLQMATKYKVSMVSISKIRLVKNNKSLKGSRKIAIIQLNSKGSVIQKFDSITDAGKAGFSTSSIGNVLAGRSKSHKGFIWKYATE